jgi:hypothetical protein
MNTYPIKFIAVLPFKLPLIKPSEGSFKFEKQSIDYKIYSSLNIKEVSKIDYTKSGLNSVVSIEFNQNHNDNKDKAFDSFCKPKNRSLLIQKSLKYLNRFLLLLKFKSNNSIRMSNVRNVGEIDLLTYIIKFDTDYQLKGRINSSHVNKSNNDEVRLTKSKDEIPNEWEILIKSQDLINHGFHKEGLILGFSLLDHLVQEFIKTKMVDFEEKEKEELIRGIEKSRLRRYLGILMKLIIGECYLDSPEKEKKLTWLNYKRNEIMHNGDSCSYDDAIKGLKLIGEILKYLKTKGLDIQLPRLRFWSNMN